MKPPDSIACLSLPIVIELQVQYCPKPAAAKEELNEWCHRLGTWQSGVVHRHALPDSAAVLWTKNRTSVEIEYLQSTGIGTPAGSSQFHQQIVEALYFPCNLSQEYQVLTIAQCQSRVFPSKLDWGYVGAIGLSWVFWAHQLHWCSIDERCWTPFQTWWVWCFKGDSVLPFIPRLL